MSDAFDKVNEIVGNARLRNADETKTLRDELAFKALEQGLIHTDLATYLRLAMNDKTPISYSEWIGIQMYKFADSILKVREKGE